ncbi:MAG: HNH endonuclease signature motif containing protein [Hyphomicrobiaceae bacterium]
MRCRVCHRTLQAGRRKFCSPECEILGRVTISSEGCWLWSGRRNSDGYGQLTIIVKIKRRAGAHRLSYRLFKGAIPRGQLVRHTCDNPACVNPAHLVLGSVKDNVADQIARGRRPLTTRSKLTPDDIRAIRSDHRPQRAIAQHYGISQKAIWNIKCFKTWGRVR